MERREEIRTVNFVGKHDCCVTPLLLEIQETGLGYRVGMKREAQEAYVHDRDMHSQPQEEGRRVRGIECMCVCVVSLVGEKGVRVHEIQSM